MYTERIMSLYRQMVAIRDTEVPFLMRRCEEIEKEVERLKKQMLLDYQTLSIKEYQNGQCRK